MGEASFSWEANPEKAKAKKTKVEKEQEDKKNKEMKKEEKANGLEEKKDVEKPAEDSKEVGHFEAFFSRLWKTLKPFYLPSPMGSQRSWTFHV